MRTPADTGTPGWHLGPLAAAEGTIRAEIVDAHLVFDAQVTVPIRAGQVDFSDATVEHVGPDSRMGVSPTGVYVDAPNGRSYVYQFSAPAIEGVEYEKRGALLGPFVTDRGGLHLQAFAESLLRQGLAAHTSGVTGQARQLLDRTAASGEIRLGDGRFATPGVRGELVGQAQSRNIVRIRSEAVGRGLTVEMASLRVRELVMGAPGAQLACEEVTGSLVLKLAPQGGQLRCTVDVSGLQLAGLRPVR